MTETTPSDRFVVETPENIRFGYDVADIGSRFLAIFMDSLIQGALYVIFFFTLVVLANQLMRIELPRPVNEALAVLVVVALFLIQFGYFLFFEIILNGQTPGKRVFGLRVIKDNGYPLSPLDSIVRNLLRIIDFFPFAYGVGLVTMFLNARAKRLGDFAAGTIVVKMRQVRLQDLQPMNVSAAAPTLMPPGILQLHETDIALVESFLQRQTSLVNRDALALQLAQRLAAKMELSAAATPQSSAEAYLFLQNAVAAFRRPHAPPSRAAL
jgi:uncharacterized RDD family membrane protein YckC